MAAIAPSMPALGYSPPAAVDNLRVYAGEDFVELIWGPSWSTSGYSSNYSESYKIFRSVDGSGPVLYATKEWTGFIDNNVTAGSVYNYTIIAFNDIGDGPGATLTAYPRPAPSIISYSPAEVKDCDQFTATLEWSAPNGTADITGYRIYGGGYGIPMATGSGARTGSVELGGWGPHTIWLSAVYADGHEVFARPVYINGPICEGGGMYSIFDLGIIVGPFIAVGAAIVIVLLLIERRKRSR